MTLPGGIFTQQLQSRVEFDEETLREVAQLTGGQYFNAMSLEDLSKVYGEIDKLESSQEEEPAQPVVHELFAPYALIALCAYALYLLTSWTLCMRVP